MAISPEMLEEKLNALRATFKSQVPGNFAQLDEACRRVMENGGEAALKDMLLVAHSLGSTSALLGFAQMSSDARALETGVRSLLEAGGQPTEEDKIALRRLLDALKAAGQ